MTLSELKTQLATSGYSVAYDSFPEGQIPEMPFIVFRVPGTSNFSADNKVYQKVQNVEVELVSQKKDLTAEAALETALSGFYWDMAASWQEDDKTWTTIYNISI